MQLSDPGIIMPILKRHGFKISKSLGQNFITDPAVCPRMAEACGASERTGVIEIGPGLGVLTASLSKRAGKVAAVELDKRLIPVLNETLSGLENVKIINGDALKIDIKGLIQNEFGGMENTIVCANLPYYITTPVIMRFLEERPGVASVTAMVQKEAAARLCAEPGTRECGAVSAAVHYFSEPRVLFEVPRASFYPQPNVDSAVIKLNVRKEPPVKPQNEKFFFALIKAAFCMRRKTILNSISAGICADKKALLPAFEAAGIKPGLRAEQLTLENFSALSDALCQAEAAK